MSNKENAKSGSKPLKSIGSKIMTADMGVIIIVSVAFAILACVMSYKTSQSSLDGSMSAAASAAASAVENKIDSYTTYTECIAGTMRLYSDDYKPEEKAAYLAQRVENGKNDGLREMMLCTPDGNDIADSKNYTTDEGFKPSIGGSNYISSPYTDDSGNLVFDIWSPSGRTVSPGRRPSARSVRPTARMTSSSSSAASRSARTAPHTCSTRPARLSSAPRPTASSRRTT